MIVREGDDFISLTKIKSYISRIDLIIDYHRHKIILSLTFNLIIIDFSSLSQIAFKCDNFQSEKFYLQISKNLILMRTHEFGFWLIPNRLDTE